MEMTKYYSMYSSMKIMELSALFGKCITELFRELKGKLMWKKSTAIFNDFLCKIDLWEYILCLVFL